MSALVRISLADVFCFMAKPTLYHIQKMQPTICILGKKWVSKNFVEIVLVYSLPYIANTVLRNVTGYFAQQNIGEVAARTEGFEVSMSPFKFLPSHKHKSNYRVTALPTNSIAFGRNIPLAPHSCIFKIKEPLIIK